MDAIPHATEALEASHRPRRPRTHVRILERAIATVLEAIARAIKAGMVSTVVEVPTFVFGEPMFQITDVTQYVKESLEARGYWVLVYPSTPVIAVGWGTDQGEGKQSSERGRSRTRSHYDVGL